LVAVAPEDDESSFSWKIPGFALIFAPVADGVGEPVGVLDSSAEVGLEVELALELGDELDDDTVVKVDATTEDDEEDEDEEEDETAEELVLCTVDVAATLGVLVDFFSSSFPPEELLPPGAKATIFAVFPLLTVTTQKLEPPAPEDLVLDLTFPLPEVGSISHGMPLQPPSGHSTLSPKSGTEPFKPESSQMGFQPSFTNVWPLASALAPAT
jgi:hypothetical protein